MRSSAGIFRGSDIADDPQQAPRRWVIDFALFPLEKAARWPAALEIVRQRVKPERAHNRREAYRRSWWRFVEPRPGMRAALDGFTRFLAVNEVGKRSLFVWCEPDWCPNNKTFALALDQDYHFGVLASSVHRLWGQYRGSTLKADRAYTPTTVFNTFPWPDPDDRVCERVAAAARRVVDERARACAGERGLTAVYNLLDEGGFVDLAAAHGELDAAVAAAYGWPARIAGDPYEVIPRLMQLNGEIAAGRSTVAEARGTYDPFPHRRRRPVFEEITLALDR